MTTKHNLGEGLSPIFAGEDRDLVFTINDADGVAVDVTGWSLSFVADTLSESTGGGGIALTTPASGIVTVSLSAADLTAQGAGTITYRFRRTDSGLNTVCAYGDLTILA